MGWGFLIFYFRVEEDDADAGPSLLRGRPFTTDDMLGAATIARDILIVRVDYEACFHIRRRALFSLCSDISEMESDAITFCLSLLIGSRLGEALPLHLKLASNSHAARQQASLSAYGFSSKNARVSRIAIECQEKLEFLGDTS